MTIDDFYSLLCCPACKGDLQLLADKGRFYCKSCAFTFPIIDGIPVLLPCNVIEEMDRLFGRYWDSEERAELYDTEVEGSDMFGVHNHISELQGLMHYIESNRLDPVLDAGCGNGRFLAALPPGTISVGLDASLSLLRITRRKGRGQFHVCAELEHLPFRDAQFGTVISCRVLQHLVRQREGVHEMCRVTRKQGITILELYNTWNPKTVYKNIRMSPYRKILNAPFRLIFRSMSPFDDWGLAYDRYNSWFEAKRWLHECGMDNFRGRGLGFGYHKYFLGPFYITSVLEKHAPRFLERYFGACLWIEQRIGPLIPFRYIMEKFVIRAVKEA
jgi:uncharacterized protein YbaR (Trm112 family)/ubiquinone/menaquinone biosynthesis C-methylase UbiE